MSSNEAPRLTPRVVALLMLCVFAVCLCADRMQCANTGRTSMCIGKEPYLCDYYYCRTRVRTPTEVSPRADCLSKGEAVVILALVEVGPSITSLRSASITSHMADELRQRIDSGAFHKDLQAAFVKTYDAPWYKEDGTPLSLLTKTFLGQSDTKTLLNTPRATTRYIVTHDAVPMTPINESTTTFAYNTWQEAVNTVLPVSRIDKASQLPQYFPGLHAALQNVSLERAASTASAAVKECNSVVVLPGLVVHPTASVRSVWATPWKAKEELTTGLEYVAGAITRYLTTSKRLLKHIQYVGYYGYIPSPPLWRFNCENTDDTIKASTETTTTPTTVAAENVTGAMEVCATNNTTLSSTTCQHMCTVHDRHRHTVDLMFGTLQHDRRSESTRYLPSSLSDCYHSALASFEPSHKTCVFEAETVRRVFDDCLHLSPEGARAMARCLVDQS